ncbi:dihydrolipoyl dehydrogenase family protein [Cellulomonas edaphi]|uniref:NAD(P)/FAD-dependent oxidoreductase n=1 Tax=Cellulomonas edaphi TaxID=3053468 RepID=A0ABT7SCB9_9CELL|nr:NAD(P)/FAD-dependent oxidoreductase [Cellulomons edaphi]MDM7832594.1 NAD(P)/FAD-dependent oxidoreductase [Cellulomons edaphi]
MAEQETTFDVIVVGAGAVGENAADRAGRSGLSVALVEHALVGGECSYWACMPSKALLRPGAVLAAAHAAPGADAAAAVDVAAALARRDEVAAHWDDSGQVGWVDSVGITLLRGHARFTGPRELALSTDGGEQRLIARHAVIVATGSAPVVPGIEGLAEARPWTSRDATSVQHVPARLVVLGGGVVGVEMATVFADFGSDVTLVVRGDRLLAAAEPFAGEAVADALADLGVTVLFGAQASAVTRDDDGVHVTLGDRTLHADEILVATGRRPRTDDLGVETLGLTPGRAIEVDDTLAAASVDGGWLFAVGDVSGRTATTHQGKYDARVAGDVVAARFGPDDAAREAERDAGPWSRYRATADEDSVPQVVFSRPEVAWVGHTEASAREAGIDVRVVPYDLANLAGASVLSPDYTGKAQLALDDARGVIVGATFVGPDVAEMLHAATVAVVGQVPLARLWHAVPAYPTLSEVWLRFGEAAGL